MKKAPKVAKTNKLLPRVDTDWQTGLTSVEAAERLNNGYGNVSVNPPAKTVGQIIKGNLFTYFNLIFTVLAICIIFVGSYKDLSFMAIVIANIFIGIIQELRSKKTIEKMTFLTEPKATVVRDGVEGTVSAERTVRDDVAIFRSGNQIYADAVVLHGTCRVNEALITGEADEIIKNPGDTLLSGSFVISGECYARLDKVGYDSFVAQLTLEAKKSGKKKKSEMMGSLDKLVKYIGIIIIPLGILLYLQETVRLDRTMAEGVVTTVGALIGMIPEGLYLLTSIALAVSVIRLARNKTLVHEMGCIETLARVDVLCVDKTGTITENAMIVKDVVLLCEDRFIEEDIRLIMSDYVGNIGAENETMYAVKKYFTGEVKQRAVKTLPFTSANKYSGVSYARDETYLLGAPEMILKERYHLYKDEVEKYSAQGCRVLLLTLYDGDIDEPGINAPLMPLALILLTNKIRQEAPDTFEFFKKQGVSVKVISGDSPLTVSRVAMEAGIENADKYIDATLLNTQRKIQRAVREFTVFGRVTPDQKRRLVRAFKAEGHTVAMTGDGVNDVLALKEADCSIAMASGSDVACHVSQLVLMDSNFACMPSVVMEGRRVINNIERSAALYLTKNIFSLLMAIIVLTIAVSYPVTASQITLISLATLGIPTFVLALEPNKKLVKGKFLSNVFKVALPGGLTNLIMVLSAIVIGEKFGLSVEEISTIATVIMGVVGLSMLFRVSWPLNGLRKLNFIVAVLVLAVGSLLMGEFFSMYPLGLTGIIMLAIFIILSPIVLFILTIIMKNAENSFSFRRKRRKA